MKLVQKTPEAMLAWFAYRCIYNHDEYDSTRKYFDKPITRTDLIEMIIKDKNIVCDTFIDCHNQIDKPEKLLLLDIILKDKDSLSKVLKRKLSSLISYEYPIIISYVIKNYPDLMDQVLQFHKLNDFKFIKSLKLDRDIEEKLNGYLVMYKLSERRKNK